MTALGKLGSCEICSSKAAIYKCPKCEMVTCSLECSKRHKRLKNFCDGIRDKTTDNPGFFCCNFVVLIGARACKTRNLWAEPSYTGPHSLPQPL